jgi:hypothetical protein
MAAATVCVRGGAREFLEIVLWESADEARQALTELLDIPCSRRCQMRHFAVVVHENGVWRATFPAPAFPSSLAEQLEACYPRETVNGEAAAWPAPAILNQPLSCPAPPSLLPQRMARGEALALAQRL